MLVSRQGDWLSAKVGDELVMMSAKKGNSLGLSEVGGRVWQLIDKPRTLDDLCAKLEEEFDVAPEVCRAEIEAFLKELSDHGAVTLDPQ